MQGEHAKGHAKGLRRACACMHAKRTCGGTHMNSKNETKVRKTQEEEQKKI